jgi:ferric-dicitrate binding protein FerR (iron transport regulator)
MKNKFSKKKAEDILSDDFWLVQQQKENQPENLLLADDETQLAIDIRNTVSEKDATLSHSQKVLLGKRIKQTISTYKRKKIIFRISTAAAILLLIGIFTILTVNKEPEIVAFARYNQSASLTGNTRLILSGKEEIQVSSDESRIAYAGNGKEIQVDSDRVQQVVEGDEVYNTVIVPYGKRTKITLSDSSSVWLNSGSKLVYPARFARDKREVYLEGEAIFEVSHNKEHPFHVITHDVEVKVLGTVFDLSAYNDDKITSTILESGLVEMKYNTNSILSTSKVRMVPGMMAVYNPEEKDVKQTKVNVKLYTSWKDGYIACEKQSLGEIVKKISRYYNVSIQLNDQSLKNEIFTGNLDLRNSAVQVLAIIAEFINIKVEKTNNQIQINRL